MEVGAISMTNTINKINNVIDNGRYTLIHDSEIGLIRVESVLDEIEQKIAEIDKKILDVNGTLAI
jgi:hypothetical protein